MKSKNVFLSVGLIFSITTISLAATPKILIEAVGPACVVQVEDLKAAPLAIVEIEGSAPYKVPRYIQKAKIREATNGGYTDFKRGNSTSGLELCKRHSNKILKKMGI